MKNNKEKHALALINPYKSVIKSFECDEDKILVGIKNTSSIPNSLMHKLEKYNYALHTIDKKSSLAGRAVDLDLINPITGHYMSGSSSGSALNVFLGINDLGIGNDGGGSVLAPAMCLNIYGFISKLIEADREINLKANTDGIVAGNSIGFMARNKDLLLKTIEYAIDIKKDDDYGIIYSDKEYLNINSKIIELENDFLPRNELAPYLKDLLNKCDVLIKEEGPIDLEGFGDSLFGHFDQRTKMIQEKSGKGYIRVANIAGATCLSIPKKELGVSILLLCESKKEKIAKLLKAAEYFDDVHDELIERYFLDINSYINDDYQI